MGHLADNRTFQAVPLNQLAGAQTRVPTPGQGDTSVVTLASPYTYGVGASGADGAALVAILPPGGAPPKGKTPPGDPNTTSYDAFQWVLAWAVVLAFLALITRTRLGYTLVYYALALVLLFLILTNYQWIASALAPIANAQGSLAG